MYLGYYQSQFCLIEIKASDEYLEALRFIEKQEKPSNENEIIKKTKQELDNYFEKGVRNFKLPLNYQQLTNFQKQVLMTLETQTMPLTYKELALKSGYEKAIRAVGTTLKVNPYPIIIPCHLVIRHDGALGQFQASSDVKRRLIWQEGLIDKLNQEKVYYFSKEQQTKLANFPILNNMFKEIELKAVIESYSHPVQALVTQIIHQQIAYKTAKKLEIDFHLLVKGNYQADNILQIPENKFREIGLSKFKVNYILNIANYIKANQEQFQELLLERNLDKLSDFLIKIKGVGPWTIEMFAIFYLNDLRIISFKDLIIVNAIKHLYKKEELESSFLEEFCQEIAGYETIISMNLWKYYETVIQS